MARPDLSEWHPFVTYDGRCMTCNAWNRSTKVCAIKGKGTEPTDSCLAYEEMRKDG